MHAYRDAIRRTAGAYVLYPGTPGRDRAFEEYHEILPSLGAFAIRPAHDGSASGLDFLARFIDAILEHLASRLTARERVTYHIAQAYRPEACITRTGPSIVLPERDHFCSSDRAVPAAEHQILIASYNSAEQLEWIKEKRKVIVSLGDQPGARRIWPFLAAVRHVLLHMHGVRIEPGLWELKSPGFEIYTSVEVKENFKYPLSPGNVYAVFDLAPSLDWSNVTWDRGILMVELKKFLSSQYLMFIRNIDDVWACTETLPLAHLMRASQRNS
jgi:hypothetical protein